MKTIAMMLTIGCATLLGATAQSASPRYIPATPGAPFSAAVETGNVLYLSGQIGARLDGTMPEGIEAQTRQVMDNIKAVLQKRGLSMDHVFKCTVFLANMAQWEEFNRVYVTYFKPDRLPARSALGANGLAKGALAEVECMARTGD